jgi:cytoskeletal protein CcmA (bactofilin family)
VKRFRSDPGSIRIRYRAVAGLALLFALAPLGASIAPSVVTTDLFIVSEDEPIAEDVYVAATSGRVEGRIDGDLVITTGSLTISGTVTGDVLALTSGTVRIEPGGVVEGSVRSVSPQVVVEGTVQQDLFTTGIAAHVDSTGSVGRDVITFGGTLTIDGEVGRDTRGRAFTATVAGTVGRDVDLTVQRLTIDSSASVAGDVLYRSTTEASIAPGTVEGQIVQLPAQSNFIFGVILSIANILGMFAFVVSGIILLWLFRSTGAASVEGIERNPLKTLLIGLLVLIGAPLLVLFLAVTLVGLPLAALLLALLLLALVFGPVPAVTAAGDTVLRRKGGLFGGFVLGAVLWRLGIWLIPIVGAFVYLIALIWGVGGWVLGAWRVRAARPVDREALPPALIVEDDPVPEGWDYPLAPKTAKGSADDLPDSARIPPPQGEESASGGGGSQASSASEPSSLSGAEEEASSASEPSADPPDTGSEIDDWGLPRR